MARRCLPPWGCCLELGCCTNIGGMPFLAYSVLKGFLEACVTLWLYYWEGQWSASGSRIYYLRRAIPSPCVCSLKSQEPSLPYACTPPNLSVLTTGLCVGPSRTSKTLKASAGCITQACGVLFLSFLKHLLHNNGFLMTVSSMYCVF